MHRSLLILTASLSLTLTACTSEPVGPETVAGVASLAVGRHTPAISVHGTFASQENGIYDPATNTVQLTLVGSGHASLLGRYSWDTSFLLDVASGTAVGTVTVTSADGSTITATTTGIGVAINGIAEIVETATITGGTRRFHGATGTLRIERTLNQGTGVSSGSISGTVNGGS